MSETIATAAVTAWLRAFAAAVAERRDELTELDAAIGDADHGVNMDRGMQAVVARLEADGQGPAGPGVTVGALLKTTGMTLVSTVGGAAGPLYGTFFLRMAAAAGDRTELTAAGLAEALAAGVEGVRARGKAEIGDKTMIDALQPAADAFTGNVERPLADALAAAAGAAAQGMRSTVPLVARKGRASYLGERSAGHQDPGATSSCMLLEAAAATLAAGPGTSGGA